MSKIVLTGDFHCHTQYSPCSDLKLSKLLEICQKKFFNVIAITDHNTIKGALEFKKIAPFKVIIGEEISTISGHVIGYFLKKEVPAGLSLDETIDQIKQQKGIVCIPHPFDSLIPARKKIAPEKLLALKDRIDLIEIFNSRSPLNYFNKKAKELAQQNNFLPIVGSDSHFAGEIGKSYMILENFDSSSNFLKSLNQAKFVVNKSSWVYHLASKCLKIKF